MPKIDSQGRLTIPCELVKQLQWKLPMDIVLSFDFEEETVQIDRADSISDKHLIAFRHLGKMGRFAFPEAAVELLKLNDGKYVIFIYNSKLYMKRLE